MLGSPLPTVRSFGRSDIQPAHHDLVDGGFIMLFPEVRGPRLEECDHGLPQPTGGHPSGLSDLALRINCPRPVGGLDNELIVAQRLRNLEPLLAGGLSLQDLMQLHRLQLDIHSVAQGAPSGARSTGEVTATQFSSSTLAPTLASSVRLWHFGAFFGTVRSCSPLFAGVQSSKTVISLALGRLVERKQKGLHIRDMEA